MLVGLLQSRLALNSSAVLFSFPRPRGQFFELQPARKSRTSSPGLNTDAAGMFRASAIFLLISSNSAFNQPTLESSISPSSAIQNTVGTLVSPYAFDTG